MHLYGEATLRRPQQLLYYLRVATEIEQEEDGPMPPTTPTSLRSPGLTQ
jgi:hypothetical protein